MPVEGVIASLKQRLPRLPYTVVNPVVREGLKPRFIVRIHEVVVPWYLRVRDLIQSSSRMAWLQDVAIVMFVELRRTRKEGIQLVMRI